jgi:stage II sporulation protein AA (anti-sigma F factor antagonist)
MASEQLATSVERDGVDGALLWLAVAGDVDMATRDAFEDAVTGALTAPAVTHVVVDLTGVGFCDSTGINALVRAWRAANERQVTLRISNPQPAVRRVLEITGVLALLTA